MQVKRISNTLDEHFNTLNRINKYVNKWISNHKEYYSETITYITKEGEILLIINLEKNAAEEG